MRAKLPDQKHLFGWIRYEDLTPIEGGQLRAFVTAIDAMDYRGISDRGAQ